MRMRIRAEFLFWPKRINGKTKWLKMATWREEEVEQACCRPGKTIKVFKPVEWLEDFDNIDWGYKDRFPRR